MTMGAGTRADTTGPSLYALWDVTRVHRSPLGVPNEVWTGAAAEYVVGNFHPGDRRWTMPKDSNRGNRDPLLVELGLLGMHHYLMSRGLPEVRIAKDPTSGWNFSLRQRCANTWTQEVPFLICPLQRTVLISAELGWLYEAPESEKGSTPEAKFTTLPSLDMADNVLSAFLFLCMAFDRVCDQVRIPASLAWLGVLPDVDAAGDFRWSGEMLAKLYSFWRDPVTPRLDFWFPPA